MAHIQIYEQKRGVLSKRKEWRWRIVARNGRILATSGEGYYNKADLWHAIRLIIICLTEEDESDGHT